MRELLDTISHKNKHSTRSKITLEYLFIYDTVIHKKAL